MLVPAGNVTPAAPTTAVPAAKKKNPCTMRLLKSETKNLMENLWNHWEFDCKFDKDELMQEFWDAATAITTFGEENIKAASKEFMRQKGQIPGLNAMPSRRLPASSTSWQA